jgi:hypothetical protein
VVVTVTRNEPIVGVRIRSEFGTVPPAEKYQTMQMRRSTATGYATTGRPVKTEMIVREKVRRDSRIAGEECMVFTFVANARRSARRRIERRLSGLYKH